MRFVHFLILATVLTAATSTNCLAAGSFQKPEPRSLITADFAPSISTANVTANDLLGGCGGKGRVRDPQTHICVGPADVR